MLLLNHPCIHTLNTKPRKECYNTHFNTNKSLFFIPILQVDKLLYLVYAQLIQHCALVILGQ